MARHFAEGAGLAAGMDTSLADEAYDCITREEYYRQQPVKAKRGRLASRANSHAHNKPRRQASAR